MVSLSSRGFFCLLAILISFPPLSTSLTLNTSTMDTTIASLAFRALARRQSGVSYNIPLPDNMAGIEASVIRVRSASLWNRGLNYGAFHIPPRTVSVPYVKRLAVVYQDLANWSASYENAPGYMLAGPVYGCVVYDASNTSSTDIRQVGLRVANRISIVFPGVEGMDMARCARFEKDGVVDVDGAMSSNVCYTGGTGHFAIVVPSEAPAREGRQGGRRRWVWVVACVGGVVGVGVVGVGISRLARRKEREKMEVHADMGEAFGNVVVGSSKMPFAEHKMRTQPVLQDVNTPYH